MLQHYNNCLSFNVIIIIVIIISLFKFDFHVTI